MAIPSLTLRSVKGSALTFAEADANFQDLANIKVGVSAGGVTSNVALNGATGAPTAITFANSATVQVVNAAGTLTFSSNISPTANVSITAGGTTTAASSFTIANNSSVGASMSGNTLSFNLASLGTPTSYNMGITTDAYGRVSSAVNSFTGNLDANQNWIGNVQLNNATLGTYIERVANIGASLSGNLTINANTAPIQTGACSGNISIFSGNLTNFVAGESVTLVLTHTANTRTLSSNLQFVNGTKTIGGTTNVTDVITIFCSQTSPTPVYLATVAKFQL